MEKHPLNKHLASQSEDLMGIGSRSGGTPPPPYEMLPPVAAASTKSKLLHWVTPKIPTRNKNPKNASNEHNENALELLKKYDTVILVDDSGSMIFPGSMKGKTRWTEAGQALAVDKKGLNIKSSSEVTSLFTEVHPKGATPTGERLDQLLKPRIKELEKAQINPDGTPRDKDTNEVIKRVNFIVITDGQASDDPKYAIIDAAQRLKAMQNLCMIQIGIQFFQVGNDRAATRALKDLDDDLAKAGDIRDIVDTTPYSKLNTVTAEGMIKVLLGSINRRIDEQKN
ncbi:hypothetical protein B0H11DRAFT_2322876 [Mycena galericulata]|nr:hypothetical protein B0H11DRAFT_2322876 [Mycena galericulata]